MAAAISDRFPKPAMGYALGNGSAIDGIVEVVLLIWALASKPSI
jgi:hypothetical protein